MGDFSHNVIERYQAGSTIIESVNTLTGDGEGPGIDTVIADSETDKLVAFSLDVSQVKAIIILSAEDMTLETNDGTTPADTMNLKAGIPYIWFTNKEDAFVLTTDVTALYLTNASGSESRLRIASVYDSTP